MRPGWLHLLNSTTSPFVGPGRKAPILLSYREFNPVYDHIHFELSFPQAMRPILVTLRNDVMNPFVPLPRPLEEKKEEEKKAEEKDGKDEGKGRGEID